MCVFETNKYMFPICFFRNMLFVQQFLFRRTFVWGTYVFPLTVFIPHILCWGSCYYWRTARRYPTILHHHTTTFLPPHTTPQHRPQPTQRGRTAPATGLRPPCTSHRLITLYSSSKWLPGGGRAEDILNSNIFKIAPVLETDLTLLKKSVPFSRK